MCRVFSLTHNCLIKGRCVHVHINERLWSTRLTLVAAHVLIVISSSWLISTLWHVQSLYVYICKVCNNFTCVSKAPKVNLKVNQWGAVIFLWQDSVTSQMSKNTSHECPRRTSFFFPALFFLYTSWSVSFFPNHSFPLILTAYVPHKNCGSPRLPHCLLFWSMVLINHLPNLPVN